MQDPLSLFPEGVLQLTPIGATKHSDGVNDFLLASTSFFFLDTTLIPLSPPDSLFWGHRFRFFLVRGKSRIDFGICCADDVWTAPGMEGKNGLEHSA